MGFMGMKRVSSGLFSDATAAALDPASSERLDRSTYGGVPGRAEP